MARNNWGKGWLDEILNQAEKTVQSWPQWMQQPELRYPLNCHSRKKAEILEHLGTKKSLYVIREFVALVIGQSMIEILGRRLSMPGGTELRVSKAKTKKCNADSLICSARSPYLPDRLTVEIDVDDALAWCVVNQPAISSRGYVECSHRRRQNNCPACFREWWEKRKSDYELHRKSKN